MHEILQALPPAARVLDLGCASGSFDAAGTAAQVVRIDRDVAIRKEGRNEGRESIVQGDASRLPFAGRAFAAVVSNHSLEHFEDLRGALSEIARVLQPEGALFVAVPDASTLCDKIYRWLSNGGGHVNPFTSAKELAAAIERATGLPHVATRTLFTSLSFLNSRNSPAPRPRRLLLLGNGSEWSLFLYAWLSRAIDRRFGLRTGVYGWAFYFGRIPGAIDTRAWVNVCLRCGAGNPSERLKEDCLLPKRLLQPRQYRCPQCGARNPFADDWQ